MTTKIKRILVTGAAGILAQELLQYLPHNTNALYAADSKQLDVRDKTAVLNIVNKFRPELIFHFAAKTNVDWCENHSLECDEVNIQGAENVARAASKYNSLLVFPSTYYLYTGLKNYPVDDRSVMLNPQNIVGVYTKSKYQAELAIRTIMPDRYFIVRLGSLFGGQKKDKKFVGKILRLAATKKEIRVVNNRFVQPSYALDVIKNILELTQTNFFGVYNMVGHGLTSYYDYAKAILEYAHIRNVKLISISAVDFRESAPRADRLQAVNGKLADLSLDLMRDWRIALKDYLSQKW